MNREQMVEKVAEVEWKNDIGETWPPIDVSETVAENYRQHARIILDAILPQVITVAELEALPVGTIVAGGDHLLQSRRQIKDEPLAWFEFYNGGWRGSGLLGSYGLAALLPVAVVWQPKVKS